MLDIFCLNQNLLSFVFQGFKEARIFWEVWEDPQSGYQQQHIIRWLAGERQLNFFGLYFGTGVDFNTSHQPNAGMFWLWLECLSIHLVTLMGNQLLFN